MTRNNKIIAAVVALIVAIVLVFAFTDSNANATPPDKVYVCKYVGTPGVDEILQTGQNPISVSTSAIPGSGSLDAASIIGFEFADAQGRSIVIAVDSQVGGGQTGEPSVSSCPPPKGPSEPPAPTETPTPEPPAPTETPTVTPPAPTETPTVTPPVPTVTETVSPPAPTVTETPVVPTETVTETPNVPTPTETVTVKPEPKPEEETPVATPNKPEAPNKPAAPSKPAPNKDVQVTQCVNGVFVTTVNGEVIAESGTCNEATSPIAEAPAPADQEGL